MKKIILVLVFLILGLNSCSDKCKGMIDIFKFAESKNSCLKTMKSLVEKGANINAKSSSGFTLLMFAIEGAHLDVVKYLIKKGADLNLKMNDGWTALISVAYDSHLNIVKYLIKKVAKDSCDGMTDIFKVAGAKSNCIVTMKYLVKKGVNVNAKNYNAYTVLMAASAGGNLDVVKYLVKKGADVNAKDDEAYTVLMTASAGGNLNIVKYLIKKGADLNAKDDEAYTVLMTASAGGNLNIVKYLIKKGADVNAKTSYGFAGPITPLSSAAEAGNLDIVKYLVENYKLDINGKGDDRGAVLMYAASGGNLDVVKYLVKNGADVNAKTSYGYTVLSFANTGMPDEDNSKVIKYLKSLGAPEGKFFQ